MKLNRLELAPRSLSVQLIASFVALVLLTAVSVGLPAIWLIRDQLQRQAWAQVEQGGRATRALYAAKQKEVAELATLAAQRPTLRSLLVKDQVSSLRTYLRTLQVGAGLGLVQICNPERQAIAWVGELGTDTLCSADADGGFFTILVGSTPQVWLVSVHPVRDMADESGNAYLVVVGIALDEAFTLEMREQTGLGQIVLVDGVPVASSLTARTILNASTQPASTAAASGRQATFSQAGTPYYAAYIPLDGSNLEAKVALAVSDIVDAQRRLVGTLVVSILVVATVGSGVGVLLARYIGWPLACLTDAADSLSKGDLATPVIVEDRVREVTLVAQALEGARSDLGRTLAQLRREKNWGDHLLEAIVEGIVTLDCTGHITFFSHGAERITGWGRDQALGRPCDDVFRPLETEELFSRLIPLPGHRKKIAVELRDGRPAVLAITVAPLLPPEDCDAETAMVFRDISEEEAVHRLLGHFLANVAHEFRTPLAAVAASAELLLDQIYELSAVELGDLLTSLHLGVFGLQTLVDNLLESASIEAGRFRVSPRPCNLGEIIAEAIRTMQPLLDKRSQCLVVELPAAIPIVQADPRRTVQVLVNLLSNAGRYAPDGTEIQIRATLSAGRVRVSVADQGPGIAPDQRKEVFRRFLHSGPSDDTAQHGTGLGLSVVKAIIEAHGGLVGVDDVPSGGSVFWFTLKVRE